MEDPTSTDRPTLTDRLSALPHTLASFRPRRARKAAALLLKTACVGSIFVTSAVGGVLLHLDTRAGRSFARDITNRILATPFQGRIEVGEIEKLGFDHATVRSATIYDADGVPIIEAEHIEARIRTLDLLRDLLADEGPLRISIPKAKIGEARVTLRPNAEGIPTIADAFLAREKTIGPPSKRATVVDIPDIEIETIHTDGDVGAPIDAEIFGVRASVTLRDDRLVAVDVMKADLGVRELLPAEVAGATEFHLRVDLRSDAARYRAFEWSGEPLGPRVLMFADVNGRWGAMPVQASASLQGTVLEADAKVIGADPAAVRSVVASVPLEATVDADLHVEGALPAALRASGTIDIKKGASKSTVALTGGVSVEDGVRVSLGATAQTVDPRMFFASAPAASVDAIGDVTIALVPGEEAPRISIRAATAPTRVLGQEVPAVDGVVVLHEGELLAFATIHEPGLPIDAFARVKDGDVAFSASATAEDLSKAPRLSAYARGRLDARVDGTFANGQLHAKVTATGRGVGTVSPPESTVSADRIQVVATLDGPVTKLVVDGSAKASGLTAGPEHLDDVRVGVTGNLLSPTVSVDVHDRDRGHIAAKGDLSILGRSVRGVTFSVERDGESARGRVAAIDFANGFSLRGAAIDQGSIGAVRGSVSLEDGEILGDLHAQNLDLDRIQRLFALPVAMGGVANVDLHVEKTARGRKGYIELELERGRLFLVDGISARLSARLDGDAAIATGFVRVVDDASDEERKRLQAVAQRSRRDGASGRALPTGPALAREDAMAEDQQRIEDTLSADLICDGPILQLSFASSSARIPGPLLSPKSYTRATGAVDVAADHVDVGCIARRLPKALRPFDRSRGRITARFRVERDEGSPYPSLRDMRLATDGLELTGKGGGWAFKDLDLALLAGFDGKTGETSANLSVFRARDALVLARADARATLDAASLLAGGARAKAAARTTPFVVQVSLPENPIGSLSAMPAGGAAAAIEGNATGILQVAGTLERPSAFASLHISDLLPPVKVDDNWIPALDVSVVASYDPNAGRGSARAEATMAGGTNVGVVDASLDLPASALLDTPTGAKLPWKASVTAELASLPLEIIPMLQLAEVTGSVTGKVSLVGINDKPSFDLDLHTEGLRVQQVPMALAVAGHVDAPGTPAPGDEGPLDPDAALATFKATFTDENGERRMSAVATGTMRWRDRLLPLPDEKAPGELFFEANKFRIAAAYPLVAGVLSKLDGTLDGSATISWGELRDGVRARIDPSSKLELTGAVAYIPQLGQELHDGHALVYVAMGDHGEQTVVVDGLQAEGSSGRIHGRVEAKLEGLAFRGASGELAIEEDEALPVTLEGVSFGKASGKVTFEAEPISRKDGLASGLYTRVKIDKAVVELPSSSSRNVQALDPAPGVRTSLLFGPPVELGKGGATPFAFDIVVAGTEVKSSTISVFLRSDRPTDDGGKPIFHAGREQRGVLITLDDRLHASGDILLERGFVILNFKKFEIDHGLVRLREEDATNPYVNLTAHWDVDSDSKIFVDYAGLLSPITDDKIHFRLDPPSFEDSSQEAIAQTLIFGQSNASAQNLAGVGATAFTGGLIGSLFGNTPLGDHIKISLGASETEQSLGTSFSINERFSFGGGFKATQQDPNNKDLQRTGNCEDLYFEWRFTNHWSLRGATGFCQYDEASTTDSNGGQGINVGLDALWQTGY